MRDLGGPMSVEGEVTVMPQPGGIADIVVQGLVAARPIRTAEPGQRAEDAGNPGRPGPAPVLAGKQLLGQLPERAEQGKIQRGAHRIGPEAARELHVPAQLPLVALHLPVEKLLQARRPRGGSS